MYLGLRAVTDPETGVADPSKVILGLSSKNVAWEIDGAGKLLSPLPLYPGNDTVAKRMEQADTLFGWSAACGMPYLTYTAEDGSAYFLWYENSRSVQLKLDTARLFGVNSLSMWRLGTIPVYENWNWTID